MSLNIPCPACRRRLNLPPSVVGRLVQCPACRHTFTAENPIEEAREVPVLEAVPERADPVPTLEPVEEPELADEPDRPRRRTSWQRAQEVRERKARQAPPPRPKKYFSFNAVIKSDSKGELSGPHTAQLEDKGLRLLQRGTEVLLVPPGGPSEHLGGNRLTITYDGRRLEIEVSCGLGPRKQLAHDLSAYLRGEVPELEPHRYRVPAGFLFLALVPLAMPAILFGKVIWMAAGVGLALLCLLVAFLCRWSTERRLGVILTTGIGSCVAALLGFLHFLLWGPINPGDWKPFQPPNGRCTILMPGTPVARTEFGPMGRQITIHTVENQMRDYAYMLAVEAIQDRNDLLLEQRFEIARQGMLQRVPGARLIDDRPLSLQGYPGHEFVNDYHNNGLIVIRMFMVEDHLYMLRGGGRGYEANDPDLKKFFDSFEFTEDPSRWTPHPAIVQPTEQPPPPGVRNQAWISQRLPARGNRQVHSVAFSPDGEYLAVGEGDHFAYHHLVVWEWKKNRVANSFLNENPIRSVQAVAFSPDGKLLAGGTNEGEVHLWDWPSGNRRPTLKPHSQAITALAFSPDSKTLASASNNGFILWDFERDRESGPAGRDTPPVQFGMKPNLVFRPDGKFLVTAGYGREIVFRNPHTGQAISRRDYPHFFGASALAFSPDGKLLVAAGQDSNVMPYNEDGEPILTSEQNFPQLKRHSPIVSLPGTTIRCLSFRKDGLLAIGGDNLLALVDPGGRKIIQNLQNVRRVSGLSFSSDGQMLAAATLDGETILYDVSLIDRPAPFADKPRDPEVIKPVVVGDEPLQPSSAVKIGPGTLRSLVFAPDGKHLAATWTRVGMGKNLMTLALWELGGKRVPISLPAGSTVMAAGLTFSEDGKRLYLLGKPDILVWDVTGGKPAATVKVPDDKLTGVRSLTLSPDGKWLAMMRRRDVVVLPADKPEDARTIDLNVQPRAVAFGPKEGQLTILTDGEMYLHRIHDITTGKQVEQRAGPAKLVGRWLLFANGRTIVLSGADRSVTAWEGTTNTTWTFPPNTLAGLPSRAALSADGKRLAVAESDGHVTLLDLAAQKKLNRVRLHSGLITGMVWTPDNQGLVTGSTIDSELRHWDVAKLEKPTK